jgi:hypothetical protein
MVNTYYTVGTVAYICIALPYLLLRIDPAFDTFWPPVANDHRDDNVEDSCDHRGGDDDDVEAQYSHPDDDLCSHETSRSRPSSSYRHGKAPMYRLDDLSSTHVGKPAGYSLGESSRSSSVHSGEPSSFSSYHDYDGENDDLDGIVIDNGNGNDNDNGNGISDNNGIPESNRRAATRFLFRIFWGAVFILIPFISRMIWPSLKGIRPLGQ